MNFDNKLIFCHLTAVECEKLIKLDGETVKNYIRLKAYCRPQSSRNYYFVPDKELRFLFGIGKSGCYKAVTKLNDIGLVEAAYCADPRGIPFKFLELKEPLSRLTIVQAKSKP